jgi:Rieske [2Fe-2S] domain
VDQRLYQRGSCRADVPPASGNQEPGRDDVIIAAKADAKGWVDVCPASALATASIIRLDFGSKTFAIYRDEERKLYATDGVCTHGNTHRPPVCRGLAPLDG